MQGAKPGAEFVKLVNNVPEDVPEDVMYTAFDCDNLRPVLKPDAALRGAVDLEGLRARNQPCGKRNVNLFRPNQIHAVILVGA